MLCIGHKLLFNHMPNISNMVVLFILGIILGNIDNVFIAHLDSDITNQFNLIMLSFLLFELLTIIIIISMIANSPKDRLDSRIKWELESEE